MLSAKFVKFLVEYAESHSTGFPIECGEFLVEYIESHSSGFPIEFGEFVEVI